MTEVSPLIGGYSEASNFLIKADPNKYVLRMYPEDGSSASIANELSAMKAAAEIGLAPKIVHVSADSHMILMEYIEGNTLTFEQVQKPEVYEKIAGAIRKIHALGQVSNTSPSFNEVVEKLYLKVSNVSPQRKEILVAIQLFRQTERELLALGAPKVLIHGDLNPRNIFVTNGNVMFIDWSETKREDPFHDLAYFCLLNNCGDVVEGKFLESYLQRIPTLEEKKRYLLIKKTNLIYFSLGMFEAAGTASIDTGEPLQNWSDYVKVLFAPNNENALTPQFFYNMGKSALENAKAIN